MREKSKPRKSRGLISRRRFGTLAGGSLAMGFSCKNNPTGPSETPLPPLGQAKGVPNSTAFENLDLMVRLARRERPGCYVYEIVGQALTTNGRLGAPDSPWGFIFRRDQAAGEPYGFYDVWQVFQDGRIASRLDVQVGPGWVEDIMPRLKIDSGRALDIVKLNGFQACADRPGAMGFARYRFIGGIPTCEAAISGSGGLILSSETGEIFERGGTCNA